MTADVDLKKAVQPPPRLLLGVSILFWGAMTEKPFLALFVAALVESSNWIRFRWNFDHNAVSKSWRITMGISLVAGILVWLDGDRYTALPSLLTWLPLLLLPIQFVQSFGMRNHLNLNAFSFFSKLHRQRNESLGLNPSIICFNFGNFYFIAAMVAASLGSFAQQPSFFIGLILLTGWLIFSRNRSRIFALLAVLAISALIGIFGQLGMSKLYHWATNYSPDGGGLSNTSPTANKTNIGSLGELKQSSAMIWRLSPAAGQAPPKLLRTASYNRYKGITWKTEIPIVAGYDDTNYRELATMAIEEDRPFFLLRENMEQNDLTKPLPSFEIRGAAIAEQTIPLAGNSSSLVDFALDGIEINPLGTVILFPQNPIINGSIRWNDSQQPEVEPFPEEDLTIDRYEFDGIHAVADSLGLKQLKTTSEKVRKIKEFFLSEFTYTRYLSIPRARAYRERPSEIEDFLTTSKRGHCEYFATAATLLLRAADIPARYTVGFSVVEKHPTKNEWIMRGTHSHAWTRFWDEQTEKWVDLDATPPDWLLAETDQRADRLLWLNDYYQRIKEDFFLWRNRPKNQLTSTIVIWTLGLVTLSFILRRLWKSKLALKKSSQPHSQNKEAITTPLHQIERIARKKLSTRNPGETFVSWLMKLKEHGVNEYELRQATDLHQHLRFDSTSMQADREEKLQKLANELKKQLRGK